MLRRRGLGWRFSGFVSLSPSPSPSSRMRENAKCGRRWNKMYKLTCLSSLLPTLSSVSCRVAHPLLHLLSDLYNTTHNVYLYPFLSSIPFERSPHFVSLQKSSLVLRLPLPPSLFVSCLEFNISHSPVGSFRWLQLPPLRTHPFHPSSLNPLL